MNASLTLEARIDEAKSWADTALSEAQHAKYASIDYYKPKAMEALKYAAMAVGYAKRAKAALESNESDARYYVIKAENMTAKSRKISLAL